MFSKGDNVRDFPFADLEDEVSPKKGSTLKDRICSGGSTFFPL